MDRRELSFESRREEELGEERGGRYEGERRRRGPWVGWVVDWGRGKDVSGQV